MNSSLIAPCGINCALCLAYQREKNRCNGCNSKENNTEYCKTCKIKNCENLKGKFCSDCKKFPCYKIKHLEKRYNPKYNTSVIDNLNYIKENGIKKFIDNERIKWKCPTCDGYICMHRSFCLDCKK